MGERVDAEGCLLYEEDAKDASVNKATEPVAPAKTSDKRGKYQTHDQNNFNVVAMLPANNSILVQVGDISPSNTLGILFHDHPTEVRVE